MLNGAPCGVVSVHSGSGAVTAANCIGCEYATVCVRGAYVALGRGVTSLFSAKRVSGEATGRLGACVADRAVLPS